MDNKALQELLQLKDPHATLQSSGYNPQPALSINN